MKRLLAAFVVALGLGSTAQAQEAQQQYLYESQQVDVADFDRIVVYGPFNVSVSVGNRPAGVSLSGPPQLLADTIAVVENGVLVIRFVEGARWSWNHGSGMHVFVSAPQLLEAEVDQAARLEIRGAHGESFAARTNGAASITLQDLDVEEARFITNGSGGIVAEGIAREGAYATRGSGSIDAKRLRVANANINVGGAGSVLADVSQLANVMLASSGGAEIVGGAQCNATEFGSGRVDCR